MTYQIVQNLCTKPYSQARGNAMGRANLIEQLRFKAHRRGEKLSMAEAAAIADSETSTPALTSAETVVVEQGSVAANDSGYNIPDPADQALPTTRDELLALVSDGKVFAAEFVKRNGDTRAMQCRLGVAKHLKGGTKAFDDAAKGILTVFDMKATGYRSIRIDSLTALTIKGQRYVSVAA